MFSQLGLCVLFILCIEATFAHLHYNIYVYLTNSVCTCYIQLRSNITTLTFIHLLNSSIIWHLWLQRVRNIATVTLSGFYYTFCTVLFIFLYDPLMKVAEATKTCRWIMYDNYIFYLCTFVGLLYSINIFTFSEPCNVLHIRERDQQDTRFFSLIYSS